MSVRLGLGVADGVPAGRVASRRRWGIALMVAVSLVAWGLLYRYWFMAGDDYTHVGFGGHPHGQFTAADWWASLGWDWNERNGRLADSVVRLVLRPGDWFYPLLAPLILTLVGIVVALTVNPDGWSRRSRPSLWIWAAGLLTVPVVTKINPGGFGQGVYWASGFVNYLLPLGLLLVCVGLFAQLGRGGHVPWAAVPGLAVLVVLTAMLHEMSALALVGVVVITVLTGARRLTRQAWTLAGIALLAFAVHMSAPGMWGRADRVSGAADVGFGPRVLHAIALSSANVWANTWPLWSLLAGVLVVLAASRARGRRDRTLAAAAAVAVVLFIGSAWVYLARLPQGVSRTTGIPAGLAWLTTLVVLFFLAVLVSVAVTLWCYRDLLGEVPLLVWVAMAGNLGFLLVAGFTVPRVSLPAGVLLLTLVLAVAFRLVDPATARSAAAASAVPVITVAVMTVTTLVWYPQVRHQVAANKAFVDTQVIPALRAAARQTGGRAEIPADLPYPSATHEAAFHLPHYQVPLHRWFGIPESVELVNPGADPADTWELEYPAGY